ncbi:hypothetical protein NP233_g10070 [Leucocoprinus birnbaumii]|uniref:Uncharacterized protein n=1 Tax=Leucocoprinus birnbaumii TaxID=56174 RepID=A0AAD5VLM8_9AGAR|nr:hypothetical protein NP233_g10070 [Leucocoprinus birnbaumii]
MRAKQFIRGRNPPLRGLINCPSQPPSNRVWWATQPGVLAFAPPPSPLSPHLVSSLLYRDRRGVEVDPAGTKLFINIIPPMTKLLKLVDAPALPYDVLRLVFEEATRSDRRKAAKYTIVSKLVCHWVEHWLYSDVQLYSERSVRKFLRTLESSTKPKLFFTTHVKSLTIAYDVHDFEWTARVLRFCSGVETLTIWAIPSHRAHDIIHQTATSRNHPYQIRQLHRPFQRSLLQNPTSYYNLLYDTFAHHLRPRHLAILIDEPLYVQRLPYPTHLGLAPVMSPDFSLSLFSNLTHLSIVNRWTEWSAWVWSWNSPSPSKDPTSHLRDLTFLPKLTHLSFEIQVGKRLSKGFFPIPTATLSSPSSRRNQKLAEYIGHSLATILTSPEMSSHLHVLLCVLSFDEEPHYTARAIKEQTSHYLTSMLEADDSPHLATPQFNRAPMRVVNDPRLVFACDREPFSEREAGSSKVWDMWKCAEEIVRIQWKGDHSGGAPFDPIVFEA